VFGLDRFLVEVAMRPEIEEGAQREQRRRELAERLERAGLEMWRNAEGAWMVRVKRRGHAHAESERRRVF
jgi:hypothetical protein